MAKEIGWENDKFLSKIGKAQKIKREIESTTNLGQIKLNDKPIQKCVSGWMGGWMDGKK